MAQSQTVSDDVLPDDLADKLDAPRSIDRDDLRQFAIEALKEVRDHLEENRKTAVSMGHVGEKSVDEVLDTDSIGEIAIRAEPLEDPKVTVWTTGSQPHWANDSWRETIYPKGLNAYNGKVTTTFDIRPI